MAYKIPRGRLYAVAWNPDGTKLAYSEMSYVRICDAQTFQTRHILVGHAGRVTSVDWNRTTNRIASASFDGTIRIWSPDGTPEYVLKGHTQEVTSVAWAKDGSQLASGGKDRTVRIWNADGSPKRVIHAGAAAVSCVAWSPDGSQLVSGDDAQEVKVWNADGTLRLVCQGQIAPLRAVVWSPNGKRFASATTGYRPEEDRNELADLRVWNSDGSLAGSATFESARFGLTWTLDGKSFIAVSERGELQTFSPKADIQLAQNVPGIGSPTAEPALALSPDGNEFAIADTGRVAVFSMKDPSKIRFSQQSSLEKQRSPNLIAIDGDRTRIILRVLARRDDVEGVSTTLKLCNLDDGSLVSLPEEITEPQAGSDSETRVAPVFSDDSDAFSSHGDRVVCILGGTRLATWNAATNKVDVIAKSDRRLIASAWSQVDDRIAYCIDDRTVRIVKSDGSKVRDLPPAEAPQNGQIQLRQPIRMKWSLDAAAVILAEGSRIEVRPVDGRKPTSFDFKRQVQDFWVARDLRRAGAQWQLNGRGGILTVCHADGSVPEEFSGFPTDVDTFDCNSDMTRFVVGRENGDCQLRRLDDRSAEPEDAHAHVNGCVMTVAFSPDGTRYATGGWDSLAKIWTSQGTMERVLEGNTHPIYKFWWSRDSKRLVSSSRNGTFCKWSVDDGRLESTLFRSEQGQPMCLPNNGRFDPALRSLAANEIVVLLEKPNGSMEIVEYPEFLKRTGLAKP